MSETGIATSPPALKAEINKTTEKSSEFQFKRREALDEENKPVFAYEFTNKDGQKVEAIFFGRGMPTTGGELTKDKFVVPIGSLRNHVQEEKKVTQATKVVPSEQTGSFAAPQYKEALAEGKVTYLVESSPRGLIDLYAHLGGDTKNLMEARREAVVNWRFKPEIIAMMDKVIAGNIVDDAGGIKARRSDANRKEGEALIVMEMQGNKAAAEVLKEKQKDLQKNDLDHRVEEMDELRKVVAKSKAQPFDVDKLAGVHVTGYEPKINPETGRYEIRSLFDATHGKYPRTSLHVTLNHPVVSHNEGAWESRDKAVVFPFKKALEVDGPPTVFSTLDTFWEVPIGKGFELPEGTTIVQMGGVKDELYREIKDDNGVKVVEYTTDMSPKVIQDLMKKYSEKNGSWYIKKLVQKVEGDYMNKNNYESTNYNRQMEITSIPTSLEEMVDVVMKHFPEDIRAKIDSQKVKDIVRGDLIAEVRNYAINKAIVDKGFSVNVATGAQWMSKDVLSATALEIGSLSGELFSHDSHATHYAEDAGAREMWNKFTEKDLWSKMPVYSQNQRRALYMCGVI